MRLTEILKPQNIKVPLAAKTKTEAISESVDLLASPAEVTDAKKVLDAVLERESTRTTGIGNGLAIPQVSVTAWDISSWPSAARSANRFPGDRRTTGQSHLAFGLPPDQTAPISTRWHQPADDHRSVSTASPLRRRRKIFTT